MFGRHFKFFIIYAPIGLILAYVTSVAENDEPWFIGLVIYLLIGAIVGNIFVFGGGGPRKKD